MQYLLLHHLLVQQASSFFASRIPPSREVAGRPLNETLHGLHSSLRLASQRLVALGPCLLPSSRLLQTVEVRRLGEMPLLLIVPDVGELNAARRRDQQMCKAFRVGGVGPEPATSE